MIAWDLPKSQTKIIFSLSTTFEKATEIYGDLMDGGFHRMDDDFVVRANSELKADRDKIIKANPDGTLNNQLKYDFFVNEEESRVGFNLTLDLDSPVAQAVLKNPYLKRDEN